MALLPDTFSGFSLSSQQGKLASTRVLRGVSDSRSVNKIETFITNKNLIPVSDITSFGKLSSISVLKGIQDVIFTTRIDTLPIIIINDNFSIQLKDFGKLNSTRIVRGITTDNNLKTYTKLPYFSPSSNPPDHSVEVTAQSLDLTTDRYTVDSLFTENNPTSSYLWSKQSTVSASTKTLYFGEQGKVKFEAGDIVRIRNATAGYSETVTVVSSNSSSITYNSNNLIPEISGTFIDSGSTLYTRRYYDESDAPFSYKNYILSLLAPGLRGTAYPFQSAAGFNETVIKQINKIGFYPPSSNPSEYTIQVTRAASEFLTVDALFTENNPTSSYILAKSTPTITPTKTLFFDTQSQMKFFSGDIVRIRNSITDYSETVTVTSANSISITYTSNNSIPQIAETYIESGSTLYRRAYYNELDAPSAYTNYIISVRSVGLRGTAYPFQSAATVDDKLRFIPKISSSYNFGNEQTANYIVNDGLIDRFKTGDFKRGSNGILDPAVIKKAPIQFWS